MEYRLFHTRNIDSLLLKNIVRSALPPMIQNMLAMLIILFYEAMVENIGAVYLAATHVVFSCFRINKTIVGGFAHGAAILIGNTLGSGMKEKAKRISHAAYLIGLVIGGFVFCAAFFFPRTLALIFVNTQENIGIVTTALKFFAPFYFIEIIGFSFEMIFIGNGFGKFVMFSEFTTNILFILGFTFLTTGLLGLGVHMAWLGFGLYQIFHSLILHAGYISGKWSHVEAEKL